MPTRRDFLMQGAATTAALALPKRLYAATSGFQTLDARTASVQLAPQGYPKTEIWGYGGAMPGPQLRLQQGARLQRRFMNDLPQASTVHWHGVRIDNAMDGVAGLTQPAVEPGQSFDYDFIAPDAGTYWYHAHNRSTEQVARGLYGALIVEEFEPPDVDREEVLILDDWLLNPETAQIDPDFASRHDRSHAGRRGNFIATNGRHDPPWTCANTNVCACASSTRPMQGFSCCRFRAWKAGRLRWTACRCPVPSRWPRRWSSAPASGPI